MLGVHPDTGGKISFKRGQYGPFVEMEKSDSKPIRASIPPSMAAESEISLEQAVELLRGPKV